MSTSARYNNGITGQGATNSLLNFTIPRGGQFFSLFLRSCFDVLQPLPRCFINVNFTHRWQEESILQMRLRLLVPSLFCSSAFFFYSEEMNKFIFSAWATTGHQAAFSLVQQQWFPLSPVWKKKWAKEKKKNKKETLSDADAVLEEDPPTVKSTGVWFENVDKWAVVCLFVLFFF